jgi:hypothetical protein
VNLGKYNDWKPPLERIRNIVPTAAATIVHVVVEQGAGEARKAQ